MQDICLFVQIKHFKKLHCFLIHGFLNLKVFRSMYNTCKKAVFIMIVKSCFYIVQHTHLMEQTDILECSGNFPLC